MLIRKTHELTWCEDSTEYKGAYHLYYSIIFKSTLYGIFYALFENDRTGSYWNPTRRERGIWEAFQNGILLYKCITVYERQLWTVLNLKNITNIFLGLVHCTLIDYPNTYLVSRLGLIDIIYFNKRNYLNAILFVRRRRVTSLFTNRDDDNITSKMTFLLLIYYIFFINFV